MIYRGQVYGEQVGEWWTSSPRDAEKFGMSRGGNRTYVVLAVDEEDEAWLARFVYAEQCGDDRATWYRIPVDQLRERWRGVRIHAGAISLEHQRELPALKEIR
jgi:hypothetical protein